MLNYDNVAFHFSQILHCIPTIPTLVEFEFVIKNNNCVLKPRVDLCV